MKKLWMVMGIVIVVAAVAGGGWVLTHKKNQKTTTPTTSSTPSSSTAPDSTAATTPAADSTITYSGSGFSPATITVKVGATVAIVNSSSQDMQFDSDPHPVHTDNTELNVGVVSPGQTMTFTVNKKGTWGYHNHLNSSQTGKIVVQ